jgi:hypothetical protein
MTATSTPTFDMLPNRRDVAEAITKDTGENLASVSRSRAARKVAPSILLLLDAFNREDAEPSAKLGYRGARNSAPVSSMGLFFLSQQTTNRGDTSLL